MSGPRKRLHGRKKRNVRILELLVITIFNKPSHIKIIQTALSMTTILTNCASITLTKV